MVGRHGEGGAAHEERVRVSWSPRRRRRWCPGATPPPAARCARPQVHWTAYVVGLLREALRGGHPTVAPKPRTELLDQVAAPLPDAGRPSQRPGPGEPESAAAASERAAD